ncbi:unnamed protein product [Hydatigera taeniaeformis]|uniref:Uncharacterized protein n=1 Tax=Hydatigena taeniaeformis TaxID=6205 RepID=A0A0R3X7V7_HYDTA|nr:unnamed protein product [Hydatigera taeniaeformis]
MLDGTGDRVRAPGAYCEDVTVEETERRDLFIPTAETGRRTKKSRKTRKEKKKKNQEEGEVEEEEEEGEVVVAVAVAVEEEEEEAERHLEDSSVVKALSILQLHILIKIASKPFLGHQTIVVMLQVKSQGEEVRTDLMKAYALCSLVLDVRHMAGKRSAAVNCSSHHFYKAAVVFEERSEGPNTSTDRQDVIYSRHGLCILIALAKKTCGALLVPQDQELMTTRRSHWGLPYNPGPVFSILFLILLYRHNRRM